MQSLGASQNSLSTADDASSSSSSLASAAQMELEFIQRVLLGPQRGNLTAIEYLLAQNLCQTSAAMQKNYGMEWKNGQKVPKITVTTTTTPNWGMERKNGQKVPKTVVVAPKTGIEKQHSNGYQSDQDDDDQRSDKSAWDGSSQSWDVQQHNDGQKQQHQNGGVGRPKRHLSECKVCGRPSMYCYYGVKCCESCKQFFRRIVAKRTLFNCFGGKNCQIGEHGIRCRGCRLDKCLLVGMDPTMINVMHQDGFAQYLVRLELRKRSAFLRKNCAENGQI